MLVGVPREIKADEYRVGLTPTAVREYVTHGHQVLVETEAGAGAGYSDDAYRRAGATIVADADAVFAQARMIVKVKEPQAVEWARLTPDHILFTYLHLAPDPAQTEGLLKSGCAAIAYETVTDPQGGLPLLAPMSEVAGRIAVFSAGETLLKHNGGMGLLGCPGCRRRGSACWAAGWWGPTPRAWPRAWAPRWWCWSAPSRACGCWTTCS
jgi:alanine dehydrogenase